MKIQTSIPLEVHPKLFSVDQKKYPSPKMVIRTRVLSSHHLPRSGEFVLIPIAGKKVWAKVTQVRHDLCREKALPEIFLAIDDSGLERRVYLSYERPTLGKEIYEDPLWEEVLPAA